MRKSAIVLCGVALLALAEPALAQQPDNIVLHEGTTKQLSPHVWAIYGNPNIAVIVGTTGTLAVDTGLGNRNGAFIASEVAKLRNPNPEGGKDGRARGARKTAGRGRQ